MPHFFFAVSATYPRLHLEADVLFLQHLSREEVLTEIRLVEVSTADFVVPLGHLQPRPTRQSPTSSYHLDTYSHGQHVIHRPHRTTWTPTATVNTSVTDLSIPLGHLQPRPTCHGYDAPFPLPSPPLPSPSHPPSPPPGLAAAAEGTPRGAACVASTVPPGGAAGRAAAPAGARCRSTRRSSRVGSGCRRAAPSRGYAPAETGPPAGSASTPPGCLQRKNIISKRKKYFF